LTGCVVSTEPGFSPEKAYRLAEQVAIRPEPFGALAYHYGTRRLNFLKSADLVTVVESLHQHSSVETTLDACAIKPDQRRAYITALAVLEASGFLESAEPRP